MTKADVLKENLGGENLLWSQSPHPAALFRGHSALLFVWGIIWTSLVVWMFGRQGKNGSVPFFFHWLMITFGVLFTLGSFTDVFKAAFSIYGITNKRLLIVRKYPWSIVVESFFAQDIEFVKKVRKTNGTGDVIFKRIRVPSGKGYRDKDIGFFGLDDVESVEQMIVRNFRTPIA